MLKSSSQIATELKQIWPCLYHIWQTDRRYWCPSIDDFMPAVLASQVNFLPYIPQVSECEEFARLLHADIIRHQITLAQAAADPIDDKFSHSWAVGRARGMNFPSVLAGRGVSHDLIFAVLDRGIYLLEPQTYAIWRPVGPVKKESEANFVYYIDM